MTIVQRLLLLVGASLVSLLVLTGINYQQMNRVYEAANYSNVNIVDSVRSIVAQPKAGKKPPSQ